jgi:large subunit ribosomal protein L5|uniref:Large ribosomal subunit protein uL5c n=1 Tax=Thorea hispida TaxID=202687 RepID=A0A1C9CAQ6_9FLOR|nr:ribosomal protein L5 [Thorea hispida]AOM65473.1 ribosomal protein L5 [Thorea hispida]ARX95842.1 50S ribosomal protein L5 [Thorea hispida]UNJ79127.1 ribosomal protein L5 [Thorea hispida]
MITPLQKKYQTKIAPEMQKHFKYKNRHQIPKLIKVTLNRGLGESVQNNKELEKSIIEFELITGQKPIITKSKKAIAGFKVREGIPIGITVNLRKEKMYTFLSKLINLALPRIKDFRGISVKHFDGRGNYNLGIKEQLIFPEINYDQVDKIRGLDIAIVTTANSDMEAIILLQMLGMPFNNTSI